MSTSDTQPADRRDDRDREVIETVDVQTMHAPIMREKRDPRDGFEPIPPWLGGLFGLLLFWGGWYLSQYAGDFRADVLDGDFAKLRVAAEPKKKADPVEIGKKLFAAQGCIACHQATGLGVPNQYPPLSKSEYVLGPASRLSRILLYGLQGPVEVAGAKFNGNMPNFGDKLKDDQIADLLTYIRQDWGNTATVVDAASVAAAREATKGRSTPMTAEELAAVVGEDKPVATAEATKAQADAKSKEAGSQPKTLPAESKTKPAVEPKPAAKGKSGASA